MDQFGVHNILPSVEVSPASKNGVQWITSQLLWSLEYDGSRSVGSVLTSSESIMNVQCSMSTWSRQRPCRMLPE